MEEECTTTACKQRLEQSTILYPDVIVAFDAGRFEDQHQAPETWRGRMRAAGAAVVGRLSATGGQLERKRGDALRVGRAAHAHAGAEGRPGIHLPPARHRHQRQRGVERGGAGRVHGH